MHHPIRPLVITDRNDVGYMMFRQAEIYEEESKFASEGWRRYITGEVRDFVDTFDEERDCAYILGSNGVRKGCMAAAHRENGEAQLRFLFVEPELRRTGAGDALFSAAIDFCISKGYERVYLWTVSHLKAARRLYVRHGFEITETCDNDQRGFHVIEERWDLDLRKKE